MAADQPQLTPTQVAAIDRFVDALYDLLQKRARSIGLMDVSIDVDGWFVDGELMFNEGPDIGFTVAVNVGEARFCELLGADEERWLEHELSNLTLTHVGPDELKNQALAVLSGVLDARRPLLKRDSE